MQYLVLICSLVQLFLNLYFLLILVRQNNILYKAIWQNKILTQIKLKVRFLPFLQCSYISSPLFINKLMKSTKNLLTILPTKLGLQSIKHIFYVVDLIDLHFLLNILWVSNKVLPLYLVVNFFLNL